MVYLGKKAYLGWRHRIVVWQEELEFEYTALSCQQLAEEEVPWTDPRKATVMGRESSHQSTGDSLHEARHLFPLP